MDLQQLTTQYIYAFEANEHAKNDFDEKDKRYQGILERLTALEGQYIEQGQAQAMINVALETQKAQEELELTALRLTNTKKELARALGLIGFVAVKVHTPQGPFMVEVNFDEGEPKIKYTPVS